MKDVFILTIDHNDLEEIEKNTFASDSNAIVKALVDKLDNQWTSYDIVVLKIGNLPE